MSRSPELISSLPDHRSLAVRRQRSCERAEHPSGEVVHDHAGVGVYLSGTTRFWMRMDYTLRRGDVLFIPEGMTHCASESGDGESLGLAVCSACMTGAWGEFFHEAFDQVRQGRSAVRRLSPESLAAVERLLEALAVELEEPQSCGELMVEGMMTQLAAHLGRAAPARVATAAEEGLPPVVADALGVIERQAANSISLQDVAHEVSRSPAHLTTLMRKHTGRTVVEWITHGRMALARQLLLSTDEGVAAIAEHVGYASASHFHRTFRQWHQVTPGKWRKAHRNDSSN